MKNMPGCERSHDSLDLVLVEAYSLCNFGDVQTLLYVRAIKCLVTMSRLAGSTISNRNDKEITKEDKKYKRHTDEAF